MTIGFDISMLMYEGSGVATYTKHLILNLVKYYPQNQYKLFYSSLRKPHAYFDFLNKIGTKAEVFTYHIPPRFLNYVWNTHSILSIQSLIGDMDIYHSSDYLRPPLKPTVKGVTTLHDLTWKKYPQYHTKDIVELHSRKMKKTIKYKDTIIVDSANTKKDLLYYFPAAVKNKIHVLYPGISDLHGAGNSKNKIKNVLKKYKVPFTHKFLLYVGAIEPRKNLETAIKTFHRFIQEKQYQNFTFLFIGRAGWKNDNIFAQISNLHLQNKIQFVGYVDDADLPCFYQAASALVYLSHYEGFGLPLLEASRCGTPSLLYKNSSMAET